MSDFITLDLVWGLLNISAPSCRCLLRDKHFWHMWTGDERNISFYGINYKTRNLKTPCCSLGTQCSLTFGKVNCISSPFFSFRSNHTYCAAKICSQFKQNIILCSKLNAVFYLES